MAFDQTSIRTTFANLIDAAPNKLTVTYSGSDYDAVKTNLMKELAYSDWGVDNKYRFSVMLSVSDFGTVPAVDEKVTIDTVEYRILNTESDSMDATLNLDLGEEYA